MITAAVSNTSLTIFSPATITGLNTNLLYVFDNNVFKTISTYTISGSTANLTLKQSVGVGGSTKIQLYTGGISSSAGSFSTSIIYATNSTIYLDENVPSLIEMMEQNNYNYTSFVFSNFITGITTQANFPSANLTLKRQPPVGKITINEGFLGSMQVHRFAALSSTMFGISSVISSPFYSTRYCAFDYNAYGDQQINSISVNITPASVYPSNANVYLSINEDYFGSPSQVSVGISTIINLNTSASDVKFTFDSPVLLSQQKYWFIIKPTTDSGLGLGKQLIFYPAITKDNYYTQSVLQSEDGVVYSATNYNGISFNLNTVRGIVLPSEDAVYNQLDQPQPIEVIYGDETNYNVFVSLASAITSHSIQKYLIDSSTPVYAIETLIDSSGQNQYEVKGTSAIYYSMIANSLTPNVVRYDFYNPQFLTKLTLESLGDYYAKGSQGTVLISATDFIGISTIEIATSPEFPESGTTTITLADYPQLYISNIDYDFGDLGKQFIALQYKIGNPINTIYSVAISGILNYLLVSNSKLYLYDLSTVKNIFTLSNSLFTSSCLGTNGIILTDTIGNVYNFSEGSVLVLGSVLNIPTSSATQLTSTLIGVSTLYDNSSAQARKRIYQLKNQSLTHLSWSTQIPEPEITLLYVTNFGILIGAYDQNQYLGKLYLYNNSLLTLLYQTYLRPDAAYFSSNSSRLYVGFSGNQIVAATFASNKLGNFEDTGISIFGTWVKQISAGQDTGSIVVITNVDTFIFSESNYVTTKISKPSYSTNDQRGLYVNVGTNNLKIVNYESTTRNQSFSNINFDPILNGFNSTFTYYATGSIVFDDITSSFSTSFYIQYPTNSIITNITFNNQNVTLEDNSFSATFEPKVPQEFSLGIYGNNVTGIGTIALYNGVSSSSAIVGINSFVPPKTINWYYKTGATDDIYGLQDGSLREANTKALASNKYQVYARFTDIYGNTTGEDELATDIIYNQIQQQANNQALPSGKIIEINPSSPASNLTQYVPPQGASSYIYSGSKITRAYGTFESDPYFASDVVSWGQLQVLALIPGVQATSGDHGTSVTLYVKTANSLSSLNSKVYTNSYTISTINNGNDYSSSVASILANLAGLSGRWIQFKLVLESASNGVTPTVQSALITYTGAGKSFFVTKTFDTSVQSTISPTPKIRRGILTANFVTNGGELVFGYTTDPTEGNPANYTVITPNQIFTLKSPSSTIKFGVILKTATDNPAFLDEFGVQLDLGPNDLYFMPPQAYFEIEQYKDPVSGLGVQSTYQFINKTIGIVSSYNWSFGTTIITPINSTLSTVFNSQNPIIGFAASGPFTVGLFATGWVEPSGIVFNSELYTRSFIAT